MKKYPKYSEKLLNEMKSAKYLERLKNSKYEIENADYFFVASEFSEESLVYSGINKNSIFICKYGIYMDNCNFIKQKSAKN